MCGNCGAMVVGVGVTGSETTMNPDFETESDPAVLLTVRLTVYEPSER
jgi:hypothetical protein